MRMVCAAALAVISLAGCDKSAAPKDGAKAVEAGPSVGELKAALDARDALAIDASTPDQAVRSLWALQDAAEKARCVARAALEKHGDPTVRRYWLLEQDPRTLGLFRGNALRWQQPRPCITQVFDREINDIKVETDTRAIVRATVKNVTPVPVGADEPAEFMKKQREDGQKYRYVFTKVEGRWLVEDVYETNGMLAEMKGEYRLFEGGEKPPYPYDTKPF